MTLVLKTDAVGFGVGDQKDGGYIGTESVKCHITKNYCLMEENIDSQKKEIREFHEQLFIGTDNNPPLKKEFEDNIKSIIQDKVTAQQNLSAITKFHSEIFEDTEARPGLHSGIVKFYRELLEDTNESKSIKSQINLVAAEIKKEQNDLIPKSKSIAEFYDKLILGDEETDSYESQIDDLYDKLFTNTESTQSIQSQFDNALVNIKKKFDEASARIKKLDQFYSDVFTDQKNEEGQITKKSLITSISDQREKLDKLISEANEKLFALTDSSLHNAFATRAQDYTNEFQKLERWTFLLTLGIIADILVFGFIQIGFILNENDFNYHLLIYQFSIAGALIFSIWMFNRNQKIAKKLAEEYHHKAAIAEAMTGYRKLYNLEHEDDEYMQLFNSLKDQLNVNPSKAIDKFLNLKSPQEKFTDTIKGEISPEILKKISELVKPYIK